MPRSHRPPKLRPSATSPEAAPRTATGLVSFALAPPVVVLVVDRPAFAALAVATLVASFAAVAVSHTATVGAPRRVAVRVPLVSLRVEIGLARTDGSRVR